VRLVGFTIRIYHDARSPKRQTLRNLLRNITHCTNLVFTVCRVSSCYSI